MTEQWHEGPELTLHAGLTDEEVRATALSAAATAWSGMTVMGGTRDDAVIETARKFAEYIANGEASQNVDD